MNEHGFFNILYTLTISYFGALCKEINDKTRQSESFSVFFGEIVLHGFSGWIFGLMANNYLKLTDITSITIFAGIGGLFGYDLVKSIAKKILNDKGIKLDDENIKK